MKKIILITALFVSSTLFAFDEIDPSDNSKAFSRSEYLVGVLGSKILDTTKITHILTPGSAKKKESNQFFQSAIARGYRYLEVYPDHQVVIIASPDVKRVKNRAVFNEFKVTHIKTVNSKLTGHKLIREMNVFKKIASFDFYGHSSPWGLILGKSKAILGPGTGRDAIVSLRDNFIDGAFATLNSCNAGLKIAPALSLGWEIPVAGAMTGSLFERIHDDGRWYNHFLTVIPGKPMTNNVSFETERHCYKGGCWRMKPGNALYSGGYWGQLSWP